MKENLARTLAVIFLLGGLAAVGVSWWLGQADVIILHAQMPESGGWTPADLTAEAGQPLHLRLTSDDVMHGFAIGQSTQPQVDLEPGKVVDLTLNFDRPGTYTFYCTRWCGPNHWRMRGTITVTGEALVPHAVTPPLYTQLGLDIDATHTARFIPAEKPSAQRGAEMQLDLSAYRSQDYYRAHSPEEAWQDLRNNPDIVSYSNQQLWDAVALIWQSNTTPASLLEARSLYAQNCAACHGESGSGDGVFSKQLPGSVMGAEQMSASGSHAVSPTDFTDPALTLSASPALLQGKLIRGGMGTGMPMWGSIFTEEQTWNLVDFLYTFQFEEVH